MVIVQNKSLSVIGLLLKLIIFLSKNHFHPDKKDTLSLKAISGSCL